jgi:hypothetical protein
VKLKTVKIQIRPSDRLQAVFDRMALMNAERAEPHQVKKEDGRIIVFRPKRG